MKERIKVLVLSGPTGVGKTRLATQLALLLQGEILSCDSVQVYTELVIGANKERDLAVPQHLIDLVSFKTAYSAHDYYEHCVKMIREVHARGHVPMIVGGTGFYLTWLLYGRPAAPAPPASLVEAVQVELKDWPWSECHAALHAVDPMYAASLAPNDYYRLVRALAIYRHTGKPLSSYRYADKGRSSLDADASLARPAACLLPVEPSSALYGESDAPCGPGAGFDFRCFYLTKDRLLLARLIDRRCEEMLQAGLLSEVIALRRQGLTTGCNAGRSIGYYQTLQLIESLQAYYAPELSDWCDAEQVDTLVRDYILGFQTASRQYARRQDAWFHAESSFFWTHWQLFDSDIHALSRYIAECFELTSQTWEAAKREPGSLLSSTHEASLSLRFDAHYARQMRTYSAALSIYSSRESRRPLLVELLTHYRSV